MHKWLILLSLLTAAASGQNIYTWVDASGQRHYSDQPAPGAETIELETAQGYAAPALPSAMPAAEEEQDPAERYTAFNIVRPAHQETLWNTGGELNVAFELAPALRPGHRVGLYIDGAMVGGLTTAGQIQVSEVFRGQHTLQTVIVDATGNELLRSVPITIMVQQTSLLNPNNPNVRGPTGPPPGPPPGPAPRPPAR
ncbi:MAG TPA: DUF4124 domain-containing protein [Gammaproteobacteria bacterium]